MKIFLFWVLPLLLDETNIPSPVQVPQTQPQQVEPEKPDTTPKRLGTNKPGDPTPLNSSTKHSEAGPLPTVSGSIKPEAPALSNDLPQGTNSFQTIPPSPVEFSQSPMPYTFEFHPAAIEQPIPRPKGAFNYVATPQSVVELKPYHRDALPSDSRKEMIEKGMSYQVFQPAATIAIPGFDRIGGRFDQQAAVIYEGMAIRYEEDGDFSVRYMIETPATEVTLRMQLLVAEEVVDSSGNREFKTIGRITLPPHRFRPSTKAMIEGGPQQWKVEQNGNSMFLRRSNNTKSIRLQRIATATFGSKPQEP